MPTKGTHLMRTSITTALATLATASLLGPVGLLAASPATAAVEETRVRPAALPLGTAPAEPVIADGTLLHFEQRIPVPGRGPYLLGRAGTAYIVGSTTPAGEHRVLRLEQDGSHRVLRDRANGALTLSDDGSRLVESRVRGEGSRIVVRDTTTGAVLHSKTTAQYLTAVGADAGEVVLGGDSGTVSWNTADGTTRRLTGHRGYLADFDTNRLASFTGDPYQGGCTVVSKLSQPRTVLWKSCGEAVVSFSPTGQMATVHKLTDGIGPGEVRVRRASGALRATYTIKGWFGAIGWEGGRALLMEAAGRRTTANVRCDGPVCERVSPTRPTETARQAG